MTTREYLTVAEVAELLRVSASTIKRLAKAGKIQGAVQLGVQWRFKREEVIAMFDAKGAA